MNNIYINNNDIDGLHFGSSSVSKVFFGSNLIYEDAAFPNLCYDVTNDISTYTATTFEDVFDTSSDKWYKLNNLDQYEEYGLYEDVSSLSNATYYNGKLVIYNNHEYEYSNGWNDLGELTQVPALPSEYTELDYVLFSGTSLTIDDLYAKSTLVSHLKFYYTVGGGSIFYGTSGNTDQDDYRFFKASNKTYYDFLDSRLEGDNWINYNTLYEIELGNNYIKHTSGTTVIASGNTRTFDYTGDAAYKMMLGEVDKGRIYHLKVWDNGTLVKDMYPCYRNADDALGMYDVVSATFYAGSDASGSVTSSTVTQYSKEYAEKYDPSNNLTFTSITEANSYDGCVYVGMVAYIDGAKYILSENHEWIPNYLRLKAVNGNATIGFINSGHTPNMSYSVDGTRTWANWNFSNISLPNGSIVYFKGNNPNGFSISGTSVQNSFTMTGTVEANGSVQSLIYGDDFEGNLTIPSGSNRCFRILFLGCSGLTTPPELPATSLANNCYMGMFHDCTSLKYAPVLPATTMKNACYQDMFWNCTSLVTPPVLPATTLINGCYSNMFGGCTSLTQSPQLPATTLYQSCYARMFNGCTNLQTAPKLPARGLITNCYQYMFSGCTSLNFIKAMFTSTPSTAYTQNWVANVASSGTYTKNASASYTTRGNSAIPNNWTVKTANT